MPWPLFARYSPIACLPPICSARCDFGMLLLLLLLLLRSPVYTAPCVVVAAQCLTASLPADPSFGPLSLLLCSTFSLLQASRTVGEAGDWGVLVSRALNEARNAMRGGGFLEACKRARQ